MKKIRCFLLLFLLFSCFEKKIIKENPLRVGIPQEFLKIIDTNDSYLSENFTLIALKPEERITSLELLLFSTRSAAFDALIIESPKTTLLKEWASDFDVKWANQIKDEIKKPFLTENGIYALPLTLDFPVFVYRKDSFEKLEKPKNLGILRDDIFLIRKKTKQSALLLSSIKEEILFLSLLASEMGIPPNRFYNYHSVKLMGFFSDFYLTKSPFSRVELSFLKGECVAAFIKLSEVGGLYEKLKKQGIIIEVEPLPSTLKSYALYDGFCLMGYGFEKKKIEPLKYFVSENFQKNFLNKGFFPSINIDLKDDATKKVIEKTAILHSPFEWEETSFLKDAIEDVLLNGRESESALIRAEARAKNVEQR